MSHQHQLSDAESTCGKEIARVVRSIEVSSESADGLFFDAIGAASHLEGEKRCVAAIMTILAPQVNESADRHFLRSYLTVAWAERVSLGSNVAVMSAIKRIPFDDSYARTFFIARADLEIQSTGLAKAKAIEEKIGAVADQQLLESMGWSARLNLARGKDAQALAEIASRLRQVEDLNVMTNLLADVHWVGTEPARELLEHYLQDPRRVPTALENVQGPTLGEEVRAILSRE